MAQTLQQTLLTPEQIHRVLSQKGFGNPNGRYWFIGLEEGGAGTIDELRIRGDQFSEIDDLIRIHTIPAFYVDMTKFVTATWVIMGLILRRLQGFSDWMDLGKSLLYQGSTLGTLGGDTVLAEILPLLSAGRSVFPHTYLVRSRTQFVREVLPMRLRLLASLIETYHPPFVFCYGRSEWENFKKLFPGVRFEALASGSRMLIGRKGPTTVILTDSFAFFWMTDKRIEELGAAVA